MYPGAGCWFHHPECWPEQCPGKLAGLQRSRVCSCLQSCRRASMEKQMFTELLTPQQMGKNRPEEGACGNGGLGASHVQCVISLPSTVRLLPVFLFLLSHFTLSDSLTPHRMQLVRLLCPACVCSGKMNSDFSLQTWLYLWSHENIECDSTGEILSNMVLKKHPSTYSTAWHMTHGLWVDESRSKDC